MNFNETDTVRKYQSMKFGGLGSKAILNSNGVSVVEFTNAATLLKPNILDEHIQ